ncbi:hypothetical protein C9I28_17270 [Pseudoduganella armeniaca]|uniref:Uncharacterized protein n=2 Tax=Pseudoduganella armeniaca TaxID=2072590 RepID=A0A2R4CC73_9BURK|nr:hypothetical protein C9I28_17270 [Pseudoduganella armeniaca]
MLLSWLAFVIALSGTFQRSCSGGLDCFVAALIALGIGSIVGLVMALASFAARKERWLSWTALLLNGVPAVTGGRVILSVISQH